MDCEEYRQAIGADPGFDGGGEHLSHCPDCRAYRDDMRLLDARIRAALTLPVPEMNLPSLDVTPRDKVVPLRTGRRAGTLGWFALAATVVLAAFVGLRYFGPGGPPQSLPEQILEHIDHEPGSLLATNEAVSNSWLESVMPATVAVMDNDAGLITYAQSCIINGHSTPHLVIRGERGPVTIILMPEEKVDAAIEFEGQSVTGIIVPVGDGSIAIVGPRGEDLQRIEHSVRNSVTWSA